MSPTTLRGRTALWSAAVATAVLVLFGAAAAWNLRRELLHNLDQEIQDAGADIAEEIDEQQAQPNRGAQGLTLAGDGDLSRFPYLEVRGAAGHLLYRGRALGNDEVILPARAGSPYSLEVGGRTLRFAVFHRNGVAYAVGKDLHSIDEALEGLLRSYLFTLPLAILAVGAGAWFIADRAVAPIKTIAIRAGNISGSGLNQRLPEVKTQDEIGHLTLVLNQMFDRLQHSFEQITRFTSDASHELRTPLTLMRLELESALESLPLTPEGRERLENLGEQCSRLSLIVDSLLLLARADNCRLALEQTHFDLTGLVRELMEDAEILAEPARLSLECNLPAEIFVCGDRRLLARTVMNLLDNAIKHNQPEGRVKVEAAMENSNVVVRIGNSGRGLPHGASEFIFERFYRGDPARGDETPGHGLGLSIAREIAQAHGGDVHLSRSDPSWTEFSLALPQEATP